MKRIWNSFKIAFSMYSRIPMPNVEWTEENMSYVMCFFPWIGTVIGGLTYLTYCLWKTIETKEIYFSELFFVAILVLIPVWVTGGIHLDGFLDTKDALSSYQSKERRLEILKDPHAGAFAILSGIVYFVFYLGIYSSLSKRSVAVIAISFMLSRTLSGLSVICFPQARKKGMVAEVSENTSKKRTKQILILYTCILTILMLMIGSVIGIVGLGTAGLVFLYYYKMAMKQFGGVTGDLAGYFLQLCEITMAAAAVIGDVILKGFGI